MNRKCYLIGVISDTHGLLQSEVQNQLQGSDIIVHAGDIGSVEISKLLKIAPLKQYGEILIKKNGLKYFRKH